MKFKQNETLRKFEQMNSTIDDFYHDVALSLRLSDSAYDILRAILLLGDGCTQTAIYKHSCLNKQTVNSSVKNSNGTAISPLRTDRAESEKYT